MLIVGGLERGLVRRGIAAEAVAGVRAPRVLGLALVRSSAISAGSTGTAKGTGGGPAAEVTAGAVELDDLGGHVAQRGADVVDLDLVNGALLAFPDLIGPLAQPAVDDHPHAALKALGGVLRRLPPDVAGKEEAVPVLPLPALVVAEPGCGGHAELGDRLAGGGVTQFGVVDQVANDCDLSVACCHRRTPVLRG